MVLQALSGLMKKEFLSKLTMVKRILPCIKWYVSAIDVCERARACMCVRVCV